MARLRAIVILAAGLAAAPALAQRVGSGSGKSSVTAPPTKSSGVARERAEMPGDDPLVEPRHGLLGAPGAALDGSGPSRLGAPSDRLSMEADLPSTWRSGDIVRSRNSADVRAARQQQAPDLEWAASTSAGSGGQRQRTGPANGRAGKTR